MRLVEVMLKRIEISRKYANEGSLVMLLWGSRLHWIHRVSIENGALTIETDDGTGTKATKPMRLAEFNMRCSGVDLEHTSLVIRDPSGCDLELETTHNEVWISAKGGVLIIDADMD